MKDDPLVHQKKKHFPVSAMMGILTILWIMTFAMVENVSSTEPQDTAIDKTAVKESRNQVVVTYFHTHFRCPTCMKLEAYSQETVKENFVKELEGKSIIFRTLNVDEPENKHYIKDYNLYTKSLIIAQTKDGKIVRWKNLPEIWKHVRDRERFEEYVQSEIREFMKDL